MKRVLIIGKNSYIGSCIRDYCRDSFEIDEFDVQNGMLEDVVFRGYDTVVLVAAIVHRKDITDWSTYQRVNIDIPVRAAEMAKASRVKQFIFMSTMAVYGVEKTISDLQVINQSTEYHPTTMYGKSKYEAEKQISRLESDEFSVAFVRPANVYGKNCKGNYINLFCKITKMFPVLPDVYTNNRQGMLYIDNLCELIKLLIENNGRGVYPAQDKESPSALEMMRVISDVKGWNKKVSKMIGVPFLIFRISLTKKLFGGVVYEQQYAEADVGEYRLVSFHEGMRRTLEEL